MFVFSELLLGVTGAGGWLCIDNLSTCGDQRTDHANQTAQCFYGKFSVMRKSIRRSLSLAGTAAFALASSLPLAIRPVAAQEPKAQTTEAADLGVMGVKLKDAVKFNWGFQGALQGAGTPNQSGIGGFLPLAIGDNSVFFLDAQANFNFGDFKGYTSLGEGPNINGGTVSTSTRLGYRWLNGDRSWMYGINAGYDSRPTLIGSSDYNNSRLFQQVALNLEAVSNKWFASTYWLLPIGEYGYNKNINDFNKNSSFLSSSPIDALMTVGGDIGYNLTPNLKVSAGYYYSEGAVLKVSDGSGVRGRLEYNIANGLTSGINIIYDPGSHQAFPAENLVLSADLKYRFGANGYGAPSIRKQEPVVMPVIQALSATPANRDVRVHDFGGCWGDNYDSAKGKWRGKFWSWNCKDGISIEFGQIQDVFRGGWSWYKDSLQYLGDVEYYKRVRERTGLQAGGPQGFDKIAGSIK